MATYCHLALILPTREASSRPPARPIQQASKGTLSADGSRHNEAEQDLRDLLERLANVEEYLDQNNPGEDSPLSWYVRGKQEHRNCPPAIANPSPLGLFGFAIVCSLAGMLKIYPNLDARIDGVFAAVAIFVGGVAQVIAGVLKYFLNETHAAIVSCFFGLHWMTMAVVTGVKSLTQLSFTDVHEEDTETYFALITLSTVILWAPTFRMNAVLCTALCSVTVTFFLHALAAIWTRRDVEVAAGAMSCVAAIIAVYRALLDLGNESWKRPVFPLFPHKDHKKDYEDSMGRPYIPRKSFHKSSMSSTHL